LTTFNAINVACYAVVAPIALSSLTVRQRPDAKPGESAMSQSCRAADAIIIIIIIIYYCYEIVHKVQISHKP